MAVDVIMPQMGESIFEGTITRWLKKPGDRVERDEPLFEISTDKVDAEIPAPSAGVLKEIKVTEGQTVPIQTVVAVIDAAGAVGAASAPAVPAAAPVPPPAREKAAAPKPRRRLLPPRPCLLRRRLPPAPRRHRPRRPPRAATAKKFAVRRWSASWRKNTTWTSPRWKEAAPADASARRIFSPQPRPAERGRGPRGAVRRGAVRFPSRRRRLAGAPSRIPRWKMPSRASGFISATMKPNR